ncbi:hypothetical protein ZHAS_00019072 [Anopheles sinensis]|uniref:Secreted protein n=1 Tax=Anopheles sinensis TaxID=74873 RepID=A0A084WLC9_ANOSI|nr:hypothetical protein ZHAS_00019072 [Anopheles sinensis]
MHHCSGIISVVSVAGLLLTLLGDSADALVCAPNDHNNAKQKNKASFGRVHLEGGEREGNRDASEGHFRRSSCR